LQGGCCDWPLFRALLHENPDFAKVRGQPEDYCTIADLWAKIERLHLDEYSSIIPVRSGQFMVSDTAM
jgi:hypothetical protein